MIRQLLCKLFGHRWTAWYDTYNIFRQQNEQLRICERCHERHARPILRWKYKA